MGQQNSPRSAFTLIELLIVIAVIAILSIVVVLTLNPAEMLRRGRDSNRVSDLDTLTHAISLYQEDQGTVGGQGSLGTSTIIYTSLPDSSSTCGSWNLPSPPSGYAYQCAPSSTYRSTNGSGWIPLNLSTITTGSPLGQLPIDPTNSSSTGLYYTYVTNGSQYEVTSLFESAQYKSQYAASPVIQNYPEVNAKGSNLTINPLWSTSGLVGYWPLDEGTGTVAVDGSGSSNNGNWSGSLINGSHYTTGKVGPYAGIFDGTSTYVNLQNNTNTYFQASGTYTWSVWFNINSFSPSNQTLVRKEAGSNTQGYRISFSVTGIGITSNATPNPTISYNTTITSGAWYQADIIYNGTGNPNVQIYLNGVLGATGNLSSVLSDVVDQTDISDNYSPGTMNGQIDDVRIYNRALSAAEVMALYNAEK